MSEEQHNSAKKRWGHVKAEVKIGMLGKAMQHKKKIAAAVTLKIVIIVVIVVVREPLSLPLSIAVIVAVVVINFSGLVVILVSIIAGFRGVSCLR